MMMMFGLVGIRDRREGKRDGGLEWEGMRGGK